MPVNIFILLCKLLEEKKSVCFILYLKILCIPSIRLQESPEQAICGFYLRLPMAYPFARNILS